MGASGCIIMHEEGVSCILNRPCVVGWKPEMVEQDLRWKMRSVEHQRLDVHVSLSILSPLQHHVPQASIQLSVPLIEKFPNQGFHYIKRTPGPASSAILYVRVASLYSSEKLKAPPSLQECHAEPSCPP